MGVLRYSLWFLGLSHVPGIRGRAWPRLTWKSKGERAVHTPLKPEWGSREGHRHGKPCLLENHPPSTISVGTSQGAGEQPRERGTVLLSAAERQPLQQHPEFAWGGEPHQSGRAEHDNVNF